MGTVDDITLELELNGEKDRNLSPGPFICGFVLGGDGLGAALRGVEKLLVRGQVESV
jgi:hypothetical protein